MVLRTTVGSAFITVLPSASRISETMYGSMQLPAVDHGGNRPHQLQWGDLEGLAEGPGGQGRRPPFVRVRDQGFVEKDALALSRQVDAGFFQHPEVFDVFIKPLPAQLQGDVGKGDVAGILQRLGRLFRPVSRGAPAVEQLGTPRNLLGPEQWKGYSGRWRRSPAPPTWSAP